MRYTMMTEADDMQFYPTEVLQSIQGPELKISGFVFHSSAVAEDIQVVKEGPVRRVLIEIALVHPGKTGHFKISVPLTPGVEQVVFGNNGVELWPHERIRTRPPMPERTA